MHFFVDFWASVVIPHELAGICQKFLNFEAENFHYYSPRPMIPTREYIERKFVEFNDLMFHGRLPAIPISMTDARTILGQCVWKIDNLPGGGRRNHSFALRFSTHYDLPEQDVEDTIIHEMIHYFIAYNGLVDDSPHGRIFRTLMHSINTAYNRRITISHRGETAPARGGEVAIAGMHAPRAKWHIIAVVTYRDGRVGIKVLPRVVPKVIDYHRKVSRVPEISKVDLYLHNDPFFNVYPTSSALRVHIIDPEALLPHLTSARPLCIDGSRLTEATR